MTAIMWSHSCVKYKADLKAVENRMVIINQKKYGERDGRVWLMSTKVYLDSTKKFWSSSADKGFSW